MASETSNNASIGGAMIPLLALGIPGDGPTAMLLGAFMIQGLSAGPLLFTTNADLCYVIFVAMGICTAPVSYTHLDVYKRQTQMTLKGVGKTVSSFLPINCFLRCDPCFFAVAVRFQGS